MSTNAHRPAVAAVFFGLSAKNARSFEAVRIFSTQVTRRPCVTAVGAVIELEGGGAFRDEATCHFGFICSSLRREQRNDVRELKSFVVGVERAISQRGARFALIIAN